MTYTNIRAKNIARAIDALSIIIKGSNHPGIITYLNIDFPESMNQKLRTERNIKPQLLVKI